MVENFCYLSRLRVNAYYGIDFHILQLVDQGY